VDYLDQFLIKEKKVDQFDVMEKGKEKTYSVFNFGFFFLFNLMAKNSTK
jgi:hypothetical protein